MCWGFRFSIPENAKAAGIAEVQGYNGRVVTSGRRIPYLERIGGNPAWKTGRYGMMMSMGRNGRLFWNAKKESLTTNENWTRLMRQRVAIPISAYVENRPDRRWNIGERAWIPGLVDYGHDGGVVAITEANDDGGRPILLTQAAAIAWLDAAQWDAIATLSGERVMFSEADVFGAAELDREMASKAPLAA